MKYTWRQELQMLEDSFARSLLVEHNIKEVTTQRQAKTGTRQFLLPTVEMLASYKKGYVRRQASSDRKWQLNRKYKKEKKYKLIESLWNELGPIKNRKLTKDQKGAIDKLIKEDGFTVEDIKSGIINDFILLNNLNSICSYEWTLFLFLSRKTGCRVFADIKEPENYLLKDQRG